MRDTAPGRTGWLVGAAGLAAAVAACSEYGIAGGGRSDKGGEPDIAVDPEAVAEAGVCDAVDVAVTVSNEGGGSLVVEAVTVEGSGWTLADPGTPFKLYAGADKVLELTGEAGATGTLLVESDDDDEPVVEVPLEAAADAPPEVRILSPADDEVLGVGPATLAAEVSDDADPPESLSLTWTSDVDGVVATGAAAADGSVTDTWAAGRTAGPHRLELRAEDGCGQAGSDAVEVCQQAGFTVDELDLSSWNFEGTATWDEEDGWLELTPAEPFEVGTAFATDQAVDGGSVSISFRFWIGDGTGADGFSLTVLDADRATTFLGGDGCGIGYGGDAPCTGGPALPGWSLEVDTYYNEGQDPTEEDHLAFTFDGDVDDPATWVALPDVEDASWHTMTVDVEDPRVTVVIDGTTWIDEDLSGDFDFTGYVGFTAGTGTYTNIHRIDSLEVTEAVCDEAARR